MQTEMSDEQVARGIAETHCMMEDPSFREQRIDVVWSSYEPQARARASRPRR
jgi:hypothetical protein